MENKTIDLVLVMLVGVIIGIGFLFFVKSETYTDREVYEIIRTPKFMIGQALSNCSLNTFQQTQEDILRDYNEVHSKTSCEGVEKYYTGKGMLSDLMRMYDDYLLVYQGDILEKIKLLPPSEMNASNGYDCEDFAHAMRCLGEQYQTNCTFYRFAEYGRVIPEGGHIGACCYVDRGRDNWDWVCL